jgi:tetratricopeptide (TPR) repeat protein
MILHLLLAASCLAADTKTAQLEFARGQLLERRGAYSEALAAYEATLKADPGSAYVNREAADLALEIGDHEKALAYAQAAAALQPRDAATLVLLGRVQWAMGRTDEAQKTFETALKLDPKSSESIYSLAGLFAEKSPDKARELLTRYLEQNPDQAGEAHFQLAKIELSLGRAKAAEKQLKEAIALDPDEDSVAARYALAQAYESEQSTDAALGTYQELLRLEPGNAQLLDHIAELYFQKDDWEKMRETLLQAKAARPDDPTANHWLALDAEKSSDWAKSIDYVRASAAFKDDPALSLRLSYYLTQAGRLDEAVKTLEAAHARWPDNDQVEYFLALGYDDVKQPEKAIPLLRHALTLTPGRHDARYQLGVLLEKLGRMDEAEPEFRHLLADKPDDASVLNYLGYSLADRGKKLDEAADLINKAVAIEPNNPAYIDSQGWVDYKLGKSKDAVSLLTKAAGMLPDDDEVWDHLGDAEFKAGDAPAAWRHWKRSESLAASGAKLPGKAAQLERQFKPEELGNYYLDYLKSVQDNIQKITGVCEFKGKILGHAFTYQCLFTFKGPDEIAVDLLGPMMMPVFRMHLTEKTFEMDPLRLEGVDPKAVTDGAYNALLLMREYLNGELYSHRPAVFKKLWRERLVESQLWRLTLDKASVRVENVVALAASQYQLSLSDFGRTEGRQVPRAYTVSGKGFELTVRFDNVKIAFDEK